MRTSPSGFGPAETQPRRMGNPRVPDCERCERFREGFGLLTGLAHAGLRADGNRVRRPSGLEPAGPCGTPSGISCGERRKRRSRFGDGKPLRRRAVRCRKPGCPAVLVFGGKVPVELRPSPFRQGRLPFPVSGSRPIRDSAAFARRPRRGFKARGGARKGSARSRGKGRRASGDRAGDPAKTGGTPRAAARPDGIPRDPARAPEGARAIFREACLARERRRFQPERRSENRKARPGGFAPFGEVSVLAAPYRSRQARYPRAKADQESVRRRKSC